MDETTMNADMGASLMGGALGGIIGLVIGIAAVVGMWKLFTKAGKPGFYAIIPLLNFKTLVDITGLPATYFWYFIIGSALSSVTLGITGLISLYVAFVVFRQLLRSFGKSDSVGNVILYLFLSGFMIPYLGLGAATYQGVQSTSDVRVLPWFK